MFFFLFVCCLLLFSFFFFCSFLRESRRFLIKFFFCRSLSLFISFFQMEFFWFKIKPYILSFDRHFALLSLPPQFFLYFVLRYYYYRFDCCVVVVRLFPYFFSNIRLNRRFIFHFREKFFLLVHPDYFLIFFIFLKGWFHDGGKGGKLENILENW